MRFFELPLVEEGFVGIPVELVNVGIFDGGHAFAVQHLLNVEDALTHLLGGDGRDGGW